MSYSPMLRTPCPLEHVTGATGGGYWAVRELGRFSNRPYNSAGRAAFTTATPGRVRPCGRSLGAPPPGSHRALCRALCRDGLLLPFIAIPYARWS